MRAASPALVSSPALASWPALAASLAALAALLLAPSAASASPQARAQSGFQAVQTAVRTVSLRGCAECKGEPDDVCEVRAGAQVRPLDEYARDRFASKDRLRLLRAKSDPDCAVETAALEESPLELAAIRWSASPPSAALAAQAKLATRGWPRAPHKRGPEDLKAATAQRSSLRTGLVCWPAAEGWPRAALQAANSCEWWLLPIKANGEPDVTAAAFPLLVDDAGRQELFPAGDARFAAAFDAGVPLDETALAAAAPGQQPAKRSNPAARSGAPVAAAAPSPANGHARPLPAGSAPLDARTPCTPAAASKTAALDRFEQWESRIRGSRPERTSLDRAAFSLDAAAWSGHCQELEVLRAALEGQLGCAVGQRGGCAPAGGAR